MSFLTGLTPLTHRPFLIVFTGRVVSILGSTVAPIALAFAVLQHGGSATDLGIVLAASVLPQLALLLIGGVFADRLPRVQVMVAANLLSAVGQGYTAGLLMFGDPVVWQLALLAAVNGMATAFFSPASQGVVPQTVPRDLLQQANALLRLSMNSIKVLGPALGGVAVAVFDPAWAITWDSLTFIISALVLSTLRIPIPQKSIPSFIRELCEGWDEFWSRTWLWVIVLQYSLVNMVWVGGFQLLGPVVANGHRGSPMSWGLVTAGLAGGLLLGGIFATWSRLTRPLLAASFATLTKTAPLIALAIPAPVSLQVLSAVIAGVGVEVFSVAFVTVMQQRVPEERLSRVVSYDMLFGLAFMPLGYIVAGPVSDLLGVAPTLFFGAALVVSSTALVLMSREIRTMRPIESEVDSLV
jgi:MFS family permease